MLISDRLDTCKLRTNATEIRQAKMVYVGTLIISILQKKHNWLLRWFI